MGVCRPDLLVSDAGDLTGSPLPYFLAVFFFSGSDSQSTHGFVVSGLSGIDFGGIRGFV